jgi:hypothetical protein
LDIDLYTVNFNSFDSILYAWILGMKNVYSVPW